MEDELGDLERSYSEEPLCGGVLIISERDVAFIVVIVEEEETLTVGVENENQSDDGLHWIPVHYREAA